MSWKRNPPGGRADPPRPEAAALQAARARFAALDGVAKAWESARDRVAPTFAGSPVERLKQERTRASQEKALLLASTSPEVERLLDVRQRKQQEIATAEGLVESSAAESSRIPDNVCSAPQRQRFRPRSGYSSASS